MLLVLVQLLVLLYCLLYHYMVSVVAAKSVESASFGIGINGYLETAGKKQESIYVKIMSTTLK